jgi:hypothetical protein
MKNIHVLPTDKPNRLHLGNSGLVLCDLNFGKNTINGQHIYITSDEEIKDRNWVYNIVSKTKFKASKQLIGLINNPNVTLTTNKKIILTTDPDLIKDDVQAIDDEFLEWFVKNPSCEYVPIITTIVSNSLNYKTNIGFESWRKEPKQETLEEAAERVSKTLSVYVSGQDDVYQGFIEGAKWQAENMPMHVLDVENTYVHIEDSVIIVEKNDKSKRTYSEEEVLKILQYYDSYKETFISQYIDKKDMEIPEEWLEQFKKKR